MRAGVGDGHYTIRLDGTLHAHAQKNLTLRRKFVITAAKNLTEIRIIHGAMDTTSISKR